MHSNARTFGFRRRTFEQIEMDVLAAKTWTFERKMENSPFEGITCIQVIPSKGLFSFLKLHIHVFFKKCLLTLNKAVVYFFYLFYVTRL